MALAQVVSPTFMSRPIKRSRSETIDLVAEKQETVSSRNFWFDDGNVVLRAEQTLFRVHGALLARHSKIFKEMFTVAQPDNSLETTLQSTPVFSLSDTVVDLEQLLFIFYDNVKALDKSDMTYDMAAAMLRLGKKYQIDYLYEEAKIAFRKDYPTSLDDWNPTIAVIPNARRGDMINLAHEISLKTVLPSLYLDFISAYSLSEIIHSGKTIDEPRFTLSIRETMIVGRDRLILYLQEQRVLHLKWIGRNRSYVGCRNPLHCNDYRMGFFESISLWKLNDGSPCNLGPWVERKHSSLCSSCNNQMQEIFNATRAAAWAKLPSFFGLDEWDKLEDEAL
ncbi:hypothetical protein CPB83DRAFT_816709 [Crepidotus variabilis]|uniref:BTB domain-containing protein n=1 Tax=Crepidotus variabilis TaxID=179855 RepID=A0A9P6JNH7_9AGAR|nr:hypothetical protein CPB83DRAFT_816709 [Crepidotus variabilis]